MSHISIILWTASLSLAITGIILGLVASINATKANLKITNVITSTFAAEESQKLFFDNIQKVMARNREVIKALQNKEITSFNLYLAAAHGTRLNPIAHSLLSIIKKTELKGLALVYQKVKQELDALWFKIIGDPAKLNQEKKLTANVQSKLEKYHLVAVNTCSVILKNYAKIIETNKAKFLAD